MILALKGAQWQSCPYLIKCASFRNSLFSWSVAPFFKVYSTESRSVITLWSSSQLSHGTSAKQADIDVALKTHYAPEIITRLSFKRLARNTARKHPDQPTPISQVKPLRVISLPVPFCCQKNTQLWLPWLLLWILHFCLPGYLLQSLHIPLQMLHFLTICVSWVCPEGKLAVIQSLLEKEECYKTAILVTCSYLRMSEILWKFVFKWSWYYWSHQVHLRGAQVRPGRFGNYWKTPSLLPSLCTCVSCQSDKKDGLGAIQARLCTWGTTWQGVPWGRPALKQTCRPSFYLEVFYPDENWSREDLLDAFVLKVHVLWGHTVQHNRHW